MAQSTTNIPSEGSDFDSDDSEELERNNLIKSRILENTDEIEVFEEVRKLTENDMQRQSLEIVLNVHPWLITYKDPLGETILWKAIKANNHQYLKILLERGCDVNEIDNRKIPPLYYAITKGNPKFNCLEDLFKYGAAVDSWQNRNGTPLTLALKKGCFSIVHSLFKHNVNVKVPDEFAHDVLINTAKLGHVKLMRTLLELEMYVKVINEKDKLGKTPLIHACENIADFEGPIIEIMLDKGASMYERDKQGRDAVFALAQHSGHPNIIELFTKRGYRLDSTNLVQEYGNNFPNAIFAAICYKSNEETILELIKIAPDEILKDVDQEGKTLIDLAKELDLVLVYRTLLNESTDSFIEITDKEEKLRFPLNCRCYTMLGPGGEFLRSLIVKRNINQLASELKSNVRVEDEHIFCAVELFDSDLPEANTKYSDEECQILENLIQNNKEEETTSLIFAIYFALALDKFKVIDLIRRNANYKTVLTNVIDEIDCQTIISFDMISFLVNLDIGDLRYLPAISINDYIPVDIIEKLDYFYVQPFFQFYYMFTEGKVNNHKFKYLKDFQLDGNTLEKAIHFRREDIAIVLLQQGSNILPSQKYEQLIESNFSKDFKKLYKESIGGGLLTLEHTARIAIRKDLQIFQEAWQNEIIRSILRFESQFYCLHEEDFKGYSPLNYAIEERDFNAIKYLIGEMSLTRTEFIEILFYKHEISSGEFLIFAESIIGDIEYENPILRAMKENNVDELKRLKELGRTNNVFFKTNAFTGSKSLNKRTTKCTRCEVWID